MPMEKGKGRGASPAIPFHRTGGQRDTCLWQYGGTCPASLHLWLQQTSQSQFLLLRASLQARMAHLIRTVPREVPATYMRRTDAVVWRGPAAVLGLPLGVGEYGANMEGPDKACSEAVTQLTLPLRHEGLELLM